MGHVGGMMRIALDKSQMGRVGGRENSKWNMGT